MTVPPVSGEAPRYRRLPGRTRGLMGSSSLWLAGDHVLLVHSRGYVETYRRFYFRDIQAILLRRTAAAWGWAVALAIPLALTVLGAMVSDGVGRVSLLVAAGAFASALLIHLVRGASCVCHVRTAVEQTELPALRRLRAARKTCERVRALVEEAQGKVAIETLARGAPGSLDPGAPPALHFEAAAPAGSPAVPQAASAPLGTPGGQSPRWHTALFSLLLADTALSAVQLAAPGRLIDAGAILLGIVEFLVAIAALLEGRRRQLDSGLRRAGVAGLVYVCAAFVASWISSVVGGVQAALQGKVAEPLSAGWLAAISIPVTAALALWGFVALRRARSAGPVRSRRPGS